MPNQSTLWEARETAIVPAEARDVDVIANCARQLTPRDVKQIIDAYRAGSYEMMSGYVWTRAMAALKRQIQSLGMEFVGEMLGRTDIDADSSIQERVTDYEAIRLAEDLGMLTGTEALRLRQSLETLMHFAARDETYGDEDVMTAEEAMRCLRSSVQSILGHPRIDVAVQFAEFRHALENKTFAITDAEMQKLEAAPYFFQRTVLSVLLALAKTAEGAQLDHALGNINTSLPLIWGKLRKPEKWQTGKTYAEVHAQGRTTAVAGLKKALMRVHGFDFVPENLRSNTFSRAAEKVLQAHEAFNNFYNEPAPMRQLAALGSAIPMPAFAICMTAVMCVRLGNGYGYSYAAQAPATELLAGLSRDRWEYFLSECLPGDRRILEKLLQSQPRSRWMDLVREFQLAGYEVRDAGVERLVQASDARQETGIERFVQEVVRRLGYNV